MGQDVWDNDDIRLKSKTPNWTSCVKVGTGEFIRGKVKGTDYSLATGVKIKDVVGFEMFTQRTYTSSSSLVYTNPKKRKVCAKSGNPNFAPKLRERPRKWKKK